MVDAEQSLMIPWDFTPVAENALLHAFNIADKMHCKKITLLHITKKDKDNEESLVRLKKVVSDKNGKHGVQLIPMVKEGNIFTTIGHAAEEIKATMVIMGTHGMKGMQKITGSWALKVIVHSKVPFIVVQEPPKDNEFKKVVFPVDFRMENKEKLHWVSFLSEFYNPKFFLVKPNSTDVGFIQKIKGNAAFSRKYMDSKNVDYEIHTMEGKKNFANETIDFAHDIDADIILIMSTKNIGLSDYVLGASEQYIIANSAKIPVMVINPRKDLTKTLGFG